MSELKFIVRGQVVEAHKVKAHIDKAPPRTSNSLKTVSMRDEAKQSLGFIVLGYSPEHWAQREKDREDAFRLYAEDPTKNKAPGTLEEWTPKWMGKNKPKRARSKPYEIESSADQCAGLMRKAGWLHVRVDEILKG
jgi:hypothetical protein